MAGTASVTTQLSTTTVSSDIFKTNKRNVLYRKYGDQGQSFFTMLETFGGVEPVDRMTWSHFEEDWYQETIKNRTLIADPGAGNSISLTLSTDSVDASNRFFPQVGEDVLFKNQVPGTITAIDVTTPSAPVLTILPKEATDNIGSIAADEEVVIYSNTFGEGTGQPEGRNQKVIEYTFKAKRMKTSTNATGTIMTERNWYSTDSDGRKTASEAFRGILTLEYYHQSRLDGAMLVDKKTTNTTLSSAGREGMWGLIPWIRPGGNTGTYNPGLFNITKFNEITNTMTRNFAKDEHYTCLGLLAYQDIEDELVDYMDEGSIVYQNYTGSPQSSKDLGLGFRSFTKTNRTYHFHEYRMFNHPKFFGATGFDFPHMGIFAPVGKMRDPRSRENIPCLRFRYKALEGNSRMMKRWVTGGMAEENKDENDVAKQHLLTEGGSEWFANNMFYLLEKA